MGSNFSQDVRSFCTKAGLRIDDFVCKVTYEVYKDVMQATPVDTGYARANWQIGIGFRPQGTIDSTNWGERLWQEAAKLSQIKAGGINYITNNCNYIIYLEYGHSKQAPNGMAGTTVERWQKHVNKVLGEMR